MKTNNFLKTTMLGLAALLGVGAANAQVDVTLGTDTVAPGGTAAIDVNWTNDLTLGTGGISSLQLELTLPAGFNVTGCTAGPALSGTSHIVSNCDTNSNPPDTTFTIAFLDLVPPGNEAMADGVIATIDIMAGGGVTPGMYPVGFTDLTNPALNAMGDTTGSNVTIMPGTNFTSSAGSITINGPAGAFTPDPVDFGNVLTGMAAGPTNVVFENVGNQDLTIDGATSSDNGDFAISNDNCDGSGGTITLMAGQTCDFDVTWTPAAAGADSATITVNTTNLPTDPSVMAMGTAFDNEPEYSSTPTPGSNIDFGNIQATPGMTASMDVDISNVATPAPPITATLDTTCTIMNDGSGVFSITAGASTSIAPGNMDTVTVQCDPVDSQTMAYTGDLSCDHNDTDGTPADPAVYSLMCMGVFTNFGSTPANGGNIDTGSQTAGSAVVTTNETLTLQETSGNGDINISNVMINNTTAGFAFAVPNLDGATITSGGSMVFTPECDVSGVSLMPGDPPANGTADLTFTTDSDVTNPAYTLSCQALPPDPIGSTSPPSGSDIVFPPASAGNVVMQTVVVSNAAGATADLTVSNCVLGGPDAGQFSVDMVPGPIAPGGSGNLDLSCSIDDDGLTYSGTLTCDTNDSDFAQFTFNLICSGVPLVIPTLSQWGIALFILMMLVAGTMTVRHRARQR